MFWPILVKREHVEEEKEEVRIDRYYRQNELQTKNRLQKV